MPTPKRTTTRRLLRATSWFTLALTLILGAVWLAGTRFTLSHAGTPFYFRGELAAGAVELMWFPTSPDGSRSGFGNPGWDFGQAGGFACTWWPRVRLRGMIHVVTIPLWLPVLATTLLALGLRRWSARPAPGTCPRCGYDLAGLPPRSRCPECGHQRRAAVLAAIGRGLLTISGFPSRPGGAEPAIDPDAATRRRGGLTRIHG